MTRVADDDTNRADDTRRLLIAIGLRLLHERGPSAAVGHIRLSSVLRRAGLTTGAAYRIWDDQVAYQRDPALEAVRFRDHVSNEGTVAAVVPAILDPAGSWYEVIRRGSEVNLRSYPEDVRFLTSLAIRASSYNDPELIEAGRQRHTEALASYSELYDTVLRWSRRRMREGSPSITLRRRWPRSRRGSGCRTLPASHTSGWSSTPRQVPRETGGGHCSPCAQSPSVSS